MNWLDHVGIIVGDLAQASRFYTDLLGTSVLESAQWHGKDADYLAGMMGQPHGLAVDASFVKVPHMNSYIELQQYSGLKPNRIRPKATDVGAIHLGLYVDSAERALARIGRPATGAIVQIPRGPCKGGKTGYLTDPDGINFQFMEVDRRPGKLPILKGADGWIDHIGIVVSDIYRSVAFYSRLLETQPVEWSALRGHEADYAAEMFGREPGLELEAGYIQIPQTNTLLELLEYSGLEQEHIQPASTDIGAMHIAIYVESIEQTLSRMGVALTGEVTDLSYGPSMGGRTACIKDPDGVNLQLMQVSHRPGNLPILKPSLASVSTA